MSTADTLTTPRRLTIVKHLAGGKDLDTTAELVRLDRSTVLDVASHHGYPSTELLTRAVGLLETKIERDNAPTELPPERRPAPTRPAAVASTPAAAGPGLTKPDEIRVLINTAKGHPSKRVQSAGNKVIDAIDRLKTLLREDEEKHAEKRRLAAEKEAADAEITRLEEALRAAKAKRRGKAVAPAASRSTTAPKGEYPCSLCGQMYDTPQGKSMHERLHCPKREGAA